MNYGYRKRRSKWKEYKLEPSLDKLPQEERESDIIYHFRSTSEPRAKLTLTRAGYLAILKKDATYFHTLWDVKLAE